MKAQFAILHSSLLILLLLYETSCAPWSTTLEESGLQTKSQVPVWARKAGFHLKPRLTQDHHQTTLGSGKTPSGIRIGDQATSRGKSNEIGMNEGISHKDNLLGENNKEESKAIPQSHVPIAYPSKSRMDKVVSESKQSPNWNRNQNQVKHDQEENKDNSQQDDEDEESEVGNNYGESDYESEDEPECLESQYWHIRGRRCVPVLCPGGNHWRDTETGECILRRYRGSGKWKKKYSKKFGVPSKNVGGLSGRVGGG